MMRRQWEVPSPGTAWPAPARPMRPLRDYLVGLVALFVAAAGASIWSGWVQAENDALTGARRDAAHAARAAADRIHDSLDAVRTSVRQIAGNSGIAQVLADAQDCRLAYSLGGGAGEGHLDVLRTDGSVVCSSLPATGGYAGGSWLPSALAAPQELTGVADPRTGLTMLLVSTPIPGLGVAAAFVDLAALGAAVAEVSSGAGALEIMVTSTDGAAVVTRWPDGARWVGEMVGATKFAAPIRSGAGRDLTGVSRVYGQAVVEGSGWRVYAGATRADALAGARRLARRQSVIAGAGLLAGLLATLLVYRRITRPIGQLRCAVRAVAAGGLDTAVTVRGPREVTDLGVEFNNLLVAVDRELVERRRAEETAREHEGNYRQMFDTSPYPIYLNDVDTLALVEVNDAAVAYYGYPRETLLAMRLVDLCPPEDVAAVEAAIAAAGPVERQRRQRQVRHDGTVVEVGITSHVLSFAGRKVRCAVVEDVTERESLERRRRQSQRLESLGQLAGGIAHDFNNLLGIILGYASMSASDVEAAARVDPAWQPLHDDLTQIVAAGDRATALTRQLLAFARADVVAETRVLDLNTVVADIEKLLLRTLGEDIRLRTDLTDRPWPVRADPGQLEQVLVNLAVNARDAMPGGGTLTIDTGPVTVDDHYAAQHPGLSVGRYMRLRVSDTGAGMSPDTVERAFEPFFTTKPKGDGTGLGLATIYGIITQAGGHAQIYSEPGRGTTVTALLPATDEAVQATAAPSRVQRPGAGEIILLVEDDDGLRTLTERVLARNGYQVITAGSAAQAHDIAATRPDIDLLLTDVVMPDQDGHSLAVALRDSHPTMRVIYMSGYTETILAARSTLPTGIILLNKPVTAHQLLATVARSLHADRSRHPHATP